MRRLSLACLIALLLGTSLSAQLPSPYYAKEWNTEGIKTAPGTGVTLCQFVEEGESTASHSLRIIISSQGLGFFAMEHMDAANTAAVRSHVIIVNAATFETNMLFVTLNPGERLRVRPYAGIGLTLQVQCSIFTI